jgi:hypothetical protein
LEVAYEKLEAAMSTLEEVLLLGKELKEEKSRCSKQVECMLEMSKMIQSLEDE